MNASHVAMGSSLRNASSAERETRRCFLERGVSRGRLAYFPQMTDGRSEKPTLVRAYQWTPRALCLPLLITHATWGATKDRVEAYPVSARLRIPLTAPCWPISRWLGCLLSAGTRRVYLYRPSAPTKRVVSGARSPSPRKLSSSLYSGGRNRWFAGSCVCTAITR
jgi:hypothetical protein